MGTFNNESAVATEAFRIGKLRAEISKHFSAGFNGKLGDKLTFSWDYYLINIEDRIVLSGRFANGYEDILEPFNVGAAQFFTNAIDSRTTGTDAALNFKDNIGKGELNVSVAGNYTQTKVVGDIKVPSSLTGQENVLFNREDVARVEKAQPTFKINSLISYEFDKYKIRLGNTVFGEVTYIHPDDGDPNNWVLNTYTNTIETRDQTFSPKIVTDLGVSYQINNNLTFTIGGNNIFNVFPDKHTHSANTSNGSFVYSRRVQQFGVSGANYFANMLIKL